MTVSTTLMTSTRTFTVLVYADYHKQIVIEILESFTNSADALEFAHKFYAESKRKEREFRGEEKEIFREDEEDDVDNGAYYVTVHDAIYDRGLPSPYKNFLSRGWRLSADRLTWSKIV